MSGRVTALYGWIPVWNRSGLTLRSVESLADMSSVLFANVCAGFICCCYEGCGVRRVLDILGAPWSLVHVGEEIGDQFCYCTPHVYRTRSGIFGLIGLDTLVHPTVGWPLMFSM